jgi:hypothetical protein
MTFVISATSRLAKIYKTSLDLKRVTGHKDLKSWTATTTPPQKNGRRKLPNAAIGRGIWLYELHCQRKKGSCGAPSAVKSNA